MSSHSALRFAINLGNAMLAGQSSGGELHGFTVELAKKMAAACQRQCELISYPAAKRIVDDAEKGHWDIAFLAVDPARKGELRFTEPYLTLDCTLLVRHESNIHTVQEMDRPGTVINVGKGSAYSLPLVRQLQHAQLQEYSTTQQALAAFLAGEGDMMANIRQLLERAARDNASVRVLPDSYSQIKQAFCVPRNDPQNYAAVSRWLTAWKEDGTLAKMEDKYIGKH